MMPRGPLQIGGRIVRESRGVVPPRFQTLTILSNPPERSCDPSAVNSRARTGALWPPVLNARIG
jgi:hypothetical protein